jgi:hypothetical protein
MVTAFAISAQMSTNGAPIGLTPITTAYRRSEIPKDRQDQPSARPAGPNAPRRLDVHREADPGVISRKYRDAPRAQASLQNFSTPITDFVLPAMSASSENPLCRPCSGTWKCATTAVTRTRSFMSTPRKVQPPPNFSS